MKTTRVALLGPVGIRCGIASYVEAAFQVMSKKGLCVEIVDFNYQLFKLLTRRARAKYLKDKMELLKGFDAINIQFESGALGSSIFSSYSNLLKICSKLHTKKILITCHHLELGFAGERSLISRIKLGLLRIFLGRFIKKICNLENVTFLFHRPDKAENFKISFNLTDQKVFDFPLTCASIADISKYRNRGARTALLKEFNLSSKFKYIVFAGFIHSNKGIHTLLETLAVLPKKYKLIIASTIHPCSLMSSRKAYIKLLNQIISSNHLYERIIFINPEEEDIFKKIIAGADIFVLPYLDTDQHGSGPFSYALSLNNNCKIFTSNTSIFLANDSYFKGCYNRFNIEFAYDLAYQIEHSDRFENQSHLKIAIEKYNLDTAIDFYCKILKIN